MIMKKWLFFIAILLLTQSGKVCAQALFNAPDTVCIHQPVTLTSNVFNQQSYYWGFCSGYLNNYPTGANLGKTYGLKIPGNIDIAYDSGYYYGFLVNTATSEFLCYFFGTSLNNEPTVTNIGSVLGGLPVNPTSLFILKDTISQHWYIYVSGGMTQATSTLARLDFGTHLYNTHPNIVNFGNYNGVLNYPKGVFVAQDADNNWYGYVVNFNNSHLIRLDFSYNESNTPLMSDLGNPLSPGGNPTLNFPTDLAGILYQGNWYFYITNLGITNGESGNGSLALLQMGDSLAPVIMLDTNINNFDFRIDSPSAVTLNLDCGELHAYNTDSTTSQLIGITIPTPSNPATYTATDYSILGGMNFPSSISSILRDSDDLYAFITNSADSSLTKIDFLQCHNSSIPSYTEVAPPAYTYDTPGIYNVYYVVNQGLPTMQVGCKQITVLAYPPININPSSTICIGDTVRLYAVSTLADSIEWFSGYNIDTSYIYRDSVKVWPAMNYTYPVTLYYPFGCIVDTSVSINVIQVAADAGPDRWILDGASTTLGGPYTSVGAVTYHWGPYYNMSDSTVKNPVVDPYTNYTYYLTVSSQYVFNVDDTLTCYANDTVNVYVNCGDFYVPNAFSPNSGNPLTAYFGMLNNNIIQLNYFRVYNRWGTKVFETTDPTAKWDGTYNGKPAEEGVYVWVGDGFCSNMKEVKRSGNVTLMR